MFEAQLFLGFPVDPLYSDQLRLKNPDLVKQFIAQENVPHKKTFSGEAQSETYLSRVTRNGIDFLGKYTGRGVSLSDAELLGAHIYSLLKKLVPDFPYDETSLYLFAVLDNLDSNSTGKRPG